MRHGPKAVTVLLLDLSLGLQWAVLQTLAWTGMMIAYSSDGSSFGETLVKTFDGQHPSPLCLIVKTGRTEQKKQNHVKPTNKLEPGLVWQALDFLLPSASQQVPATGQFALARRFTPPKPRPRRGRIGHFHPNGGG